MVYADVPEHAGFESGEQPEKLPATPTATDEWLSRISGQLQVFVDAINAAREDDEADADSDGDDGEEGSGKPADPAAKSTQAGGGDPDAGPGQKDAATTPAKKTTAPAAKRAEVKGD